MNKSSQMSSANSLRRQPKQQRGQQRVAKILTAAAEVFAQVGYAAATTQQIADRANTAVGSIYQFFPDKLAIFHALEAEHMQQVAIVNARLVAKDLRRPLVQTIGDIVDAHAQYFEQPIPRIVYLQYFLESHPGLFILFDENFDRLLIHQFADLCQQRNPQLSREKSELIAEVFHRTYNGLFLVALKADLAHRQKLYTELKDLLCAYLNPYIGDDLLILHSKVMKCVECGSDRVAKNGHRHNKQRYICGACGRQFADEYRVRGYPPQVKQQCLDLHHQGMSFREIERQTGVSHNTAINWVRQSHADVDSEA
ncbi:TetR family transcriptional regulator [Chamaesiphon sp. OTE_20_metabat_361]|uniref:TetR/AcrR family transcriptional regulator n=1 Tax=Chamaesiphon sp. OTE_20_metabat_361 TaxID=2964689 RepID=UPI00286BD693|nr:TetR family transcriptional regulator [Chamaesiphon sp. OTE_20_metabat_361]